MMRLKNFNNPYEKVSHTGWLFVVFLGKKEFSELNRMIYEYREGYLLRRGEEDHEHY